MRNMLEYLKEYKFESVLAPLLKMAEAGLDLIVPLVIADMIDNGIRSADKTRVFEAGGILLLLAITGLLFSFTAQYFAARAATGFSAKLRHGLFEHIQSFSFTELDEAGTSSLITRMTSDVNQVQNGINMLLRLFLRSPVIVVGAVVMSFTIDFSSAVIFLVTVVLLSAAVVVLMKITIPLYRRVQDGLDRILAKTRENLTGVRVIRAFHNEERESREFLDENENLKRLQLFTGKISALMNPATYVMVNAATVALIYTGALRVDGGTLTQGQVVALVNYMAQILVELVKFANLIITVTRGAASFVRIKAVFQIQPSMGILSETERKEGGESAFQTSSSMEGLSETERKEGGESAFQTSSSMESPVKTGNKEGSESVLQTRRQTKSPGVTNPKSDIKSAQTSLKDGKSRQIAVEFQDVSMRYKNAGADALSGLTFKAFSGDTIGIIGGTGSGKTTAVSLIPRFYDASKGKVLVCGRDVKDYPLRELRSKIGIVMQKSVLFRGTVRENLLWGNENATDEELKESLLMSQSYEFVSAMPGGLGAEIEQGGRNLSGGQRQRLCIARALVRKPRILILDDSSSALDFATEAKLRRSLSELEKTTVFIISQRASTLIHADSIIVLDEGKVEGIGTHSELRNTCGAYREIYDSQFK